MTPLNLAFGYFPRQLDISAGPVKISSHPELARMVSRVESSELVVDEWVYAPTIFRHKPDGTKTRNPYPERIFGLPKTHLFSHAAADNEEHIAFHLWCLSFFVGMRLTSTDVGFVDATPIKEGVLCDFVLIGCNIEDCVSLAEAFWLGNRDVAERAKLVAAIIHALFLSKRPQHLQFERFSLLYSAIDACFALAKSFHPQQKAVPHAERIQWMCRIFGTPIPHWADQCEQARAEVADIRNQNVHEARFMGEPLGFALHGVGGNTNLNLEMEELLCRLLVGLLGNQLEDYVMTAVGTYQRCGLTVRPRV